MAAANISHQNLSDSDSEVDTLFDSPETQQKKRQAKSKTPDDVPAPTSHTNGTRAHPTESRYSAEEAHEASLRAELDSIRTINRVVEDVVASLQKAKDNMTTVNNTINHSQTLLQTWTRILSATEHNQRLILNPNWHGASQDLADLENEEAHRQAAEQRRQVEEQRRKEEATRRAEDDERKRAAAARTPGKASRGSSGYGRVSRGRVATGSSSRTVSGTGSTSAGYVCVGGQRGVGRGSNTGRAAVSGIGRGVRGRGRGAAT